MTGIVSALKTNDDVGLLRQPVDDLALPFVAPLGADDDHISHSQLFPLPSSKTTTRSARKMSVPIKGPPCPIMRPAQIAAGTARTRGAPPDKGSGRARQART